MIDDKIHALLFSVRRSVRYHNHRIQFYKLVTLWLNFNCLLLASSILFMLLTDPNNINIPLQVILFFIICAFTLNFKAQRKAVKHSKLMHQFIALEKTMVSQLNPNLDHLNGWLSTRLNIETKEPPVLHVLNVICHNELIKEMGYGNQFIVKISFFQKLFSHFFDYKKQCFDAY